MQARKVANDTIRGKCRGKETTAWCEKYHIQNTASFGTKKWGEANGRALAQVWCNRLQQLYDAYVEANDPTFRYDADWVAGIQCPPGLLKDVEDTIRPANVGHARMRLDAILAVSTEA